MKNKVLLALLLVLVFTLGILSVRAYDKYQVQERIKAQAALIEQRAKEDSAKQAEATRAALEAQNKADLLKSCQAGLKAYNSLTAAQQAKIAKPDCSLEQVQ